MHYGDISRKSIRYVLILHVLIQGHSHPPPEPIQPPTSSGKSKGTHAV